MNEIIALWNQFGAAHPIYSHVLALLVGGFFGPRIMAWLETKGISKFTDWADSHQKVLLARAGLTAEQIRLIREHEVADMRRAADELESNLKEEAAAETAARPPAPAA
jgi:hypothetical protein